MLHRRGGQKFQWRRDNRPLEPGGYVGIVDFDGVFFEVIL